MIVNAYKIAISSGAQFKINDLIITCAKIDTQKEDQPAYSFVPTASIFSFHLQV